MAKTASDVYVAFVGHLVSRLEDTERPVSDKELEVIERFLRDQKIAEPAGDPNLVHPAVADMAKKRALVEAADG